MDRYFNVRVYGLLVKDGHLLVSDEYCNGTYMTKLPGGGLEFGEGPASQTGHDAGTPHRQAAIAGIQRQVGDETVK